MATGVAEASEDTAPPQPPIVAATWARGVVVVAAAVYAIGFTRMGWQNHGGFGTFGFDLGIYDQGLWLLSRFTTPFVTVMGRNLFGDHTSFILLPLVPLWWILPGAKTLIALQSLALAAAAVPAFLIGRETLRDERLAAGIAVAFLAHPATGWISMEQFHPDAFEPVLLLFAVWFALRRRWVGYAVFLVLFLAVKEDTPLVAAALGVWIMVKLDRRVGVLTIAGSAAYLAIAMWWILPALNDIGSLNGWRLPFGGPGGIIRTAFTNPTQLVRHFTSDGRPFYAWQLVAPVAALALFAPWLALVAAVPIGVNTLSTFWYQYHLPYHYTAPIVPALVAATAVGIARFRSVRVRTGLVVVVVACSLTAGWFWGAFPAARHPAPLGNPNYPGFAETRALLARIPDGASVSAYYPYLTHVDLRREIYEFPNPWRTRYYGTSPDGGQRLPAADYIEYVVLPQTITDPEDQKTAAQIAPLYDVWARGGTIVILRRKA